jgi:hypothetical protein
MVVEGEAAPLVILLSENVWLAGAAAPPSVTGSPTKVGTKHSPNISQEPKSELLPPTKNTGCAVAGAAVNTNSAVMAAPAARINLMRLK